MPRHFILFGQCRANGFIAASRPGPQLPRGQHSQANIPAPIKQPSRDFGANVDVPQPGHITRALVNVVF